MEKQDSYTSSVPRVTVKKGQVRMFVHKVCVQGSWYNLRVPLTIPYIVSSQELAVRLINSHKLPCYLEEELCAQLEVFGRQETLSHLDQLAEDSGLYEGSVPEEGTGVIIEKWANCFAENSVEYAPVLDSRGGSLGVTVGGSLGVTVGGSLGVTVGRTDLQFPEVYHKLIHSPALETLLQLEHTYALAVLEMCNARDNAMELMQKRHDRELSEAMQGLGTSSSEADINTMMRAYTLERESGEGVWSSELSQLQESQRREYREWVLKLHEETAQKVKVPSAVSWGAGVGGTLDEAEDQPPPLEESFTIHLGTQQKTMHNVRVLCSDPLDLCQHKAGHAHPAASPERLLTAMSLYSSKLSALIAMVDGRVNSLGGIKEAFANVCHQSTDFHFQDVDVQLSQVQECALIGNSQRREHKFSESLSSHASDSQISRSNSPYSTVDRNGSAEGLLNKSTSSSLFLSSQEPSSSTLLDTTSVSLEPGDFYVTRHSNLSSVHIVLHLVTEEAAVQSQSLKSRHPVVLGLKNCLRAAARHDVHHITLPLLLVHSMQPDMTIGWCLKRAELIFKCVKGFMLENSSWGDGASRTIQFLVPKGISKDMFEEFSDMLPKVFRVTSSRNLTSTTGYK